MRAEDVFWALHDGLPRQAPGSVDTTTRLLGLVGAAPGSHVLDVGAGPGAASLPLARSGLRVTAVDTSEPFLRSARSAAARAGLAGHVAAVRARMEALPVRDGGVDLIWAEASVYLMGFDRALRAWWRLLAPGAALVLTELELTAADVPEPVQQFWRAAYPGVTTTEGNVAVAGRAGYRVEARYLLPDSDWWDEYYDEIERRAADLRAGPSGHDRRVLDVLGAELREVELRRSYPWAYGYAGYVLRPAGR